MVGKKTVFIYVINLRVLSAEEGGSIKFGYLDEGVFVVCLLSGPDVMTSAVLSERSCSGTIVSPAVGCS